MLKEDESMAHPPLSQVLVVKKFLTSETSVNYSSTIPASTHFFDTSSASFRAWA